jgi:hypothetical protein
VKNRLDFSGPVPQILVPFYTLSPRLSIGGMEHVNADNKIPSICRKKTVIGPTGPNFDSDCTAAFRTTPFIGGLGGIDINSLINATAGKMDSDVSPLFTPQVSGHIAFATQI